MADQIYIATRNLDGTEWGLTGPETFVKNPQLQTDVDNGPLILVQIFEAPSYEDAKECFEKVRDEWIDREADSFSLEKLKELILVAESHGKKEYDFHLLIYEKELEEDGYLTVSWFWGGDAVSRADFAIHMNNLVVTIRNENDDGRPWLSIEPDPINLFAAMIFGASKS